MTQREILDDTIRTWEHERPDLDLAAMFTVLRITHLMNVASKGLDEVVGRHGISLGEFDVLATLRRHGRGARLTPTFLARVAMVSPGGMTNRLDRLEAAGYVRRAPDPSDRRGSLVSLTESGTAITDRALEDLVEAENELLGVLGAADRTRIDRALDRLIARIDSVP